MQTTEVTGALLPGKKLGRYQRQRVSGEHRFRGAGAIGIPADGDLVCHGLVFPTSAWQRESAMITTREVASREAPFIR